MRNLWVAGAGVAVVALLGAGCTNGSTSPTTTAAKKTTTATTTAGSVKVANTTACTNLTTIHAKPAGSVTDAEYHQLVQDLRHSGDIKLKVDGLYLEKAVKAKHADGIGRAVRSAVKVCKKLGLH